MGRSSKVVILFVTGALGFFTYRQLTAFHPPSDKTGCPGFTYTGDYKKDRLFKGNRDATVFEQGLYHLSADVSFVPTEDNKGIIDGRLSLFFDKKVKVGPANDYLKSICARIADMRLSTTVLNLQVPRFKKESRLRALRDKIERDGIFEDAGVAGKRGMNF